jgi:hypothetical protein
MGRLSFVSDKRRDGESAGIIAADGGREALAFAAESALAERDARNPLVSLASKVPVALIV